MGVIRKRKGVTLMMMLMTKNKKKKMMHVFMYVRMYVGACM
jgi:hypothetical protein